MATGGEGGGEGGFVVIRAKDAQVASSAILDTSGGSIFIGTGVVIEPAACVRGPAIIRHGCTVRHGAKPSSGVWLAAIVRARTQPAHRW